MRRLGAIMLASALAWGCSSSPVRIESHALPNRPSLSPERLIIAAVDNGSAALFSRAGSTPRGYDTVATYGPTAHSVAVMRALEEDYGLREVNAWPILPLHLHCAVLEAPEGANRAALLTQLSQDSRIKLVQPLQTFSTRTEQYNDPYVSLQRGFQQMDVAKAHPWSRGEGVKVGLIDTGVDVQHKDLWSNITAAANFVDNDSEQFLRDRHGTEMAGVIAAVANNREGIVGVAPGAHIRVYKACWQLHVDDDTAKCNSFTLARALVAAFDDHVQVINLSLAGPDDPLLGDLIREGLRRGILFVGAAPTQPLESTSLLHQPGVIEVAGAEGHSAAGEHSAGASIIFAPGREILTLLPGGRYDFASGDSIATAEITGVVSLLLSKNHGLTASAVYELLRNSRVRSDNPAADSPSVDACAAVTALLRHGTCSHTPDTERRLADEQGHRVAPP